MGINPQSHFYGAMPSQILHLVRHNAIIKEKATAISDDLKTKAGCRDLPLSEPRRLVVGAEKNLSYQICVCHEEPQAADLILL